MRITPPRTCRVIIACGVLHNIAKDRNLPLGEDLPEDGNDDMEEVDQENGAGNGFRLGQSFTEQHF